jgi:hypothetical protein
METRKLIELPSGARVKIRCLSVYDLMLIEQPPKNPTEAQRIAAGVSMVRAILTRCTGQIRAKDGTRKRIVDKHFDDADDLTEITIEELDQADADKIVAEVHALSNLKEAGDKPKPFPEKQKDAGHQCASAGQDLPQAAE